MKKHFLTIAIIAFTGIFIFNSCQKEIFCTDCKENKPPEVDVYVAGFEYNRSIAGGRLWKNGMTYKLTDGTSGSEEAYVRSVFVSGNDVCAVGIYTGGGATLWKNGVANYLEGGLDATSVYVSVGDVYIAGIVVKGTGEWVATVWKNGVPQYLTDGAKTAYAQSVYVSGKDVYVAGYERISTNIYGSIYRAKLWKNGVVQNLSTDTENAGANSVYVSGSDVYVVGYEVNGNGVYIARLWKNGAVQDLGDGTHNSIASSVFVYGHDVYVAGSDGDVATLWKNGVAQDLGFFGQARSVFVSGNDVYVAGDTEQYPFTYHTIVAKLWKNGAVQDLSDGTNDAYAYSVFVIRK